jgi:hypothetical protein
MPSSSVRRTSVFNPQMVRVTGATIISFRRSMTSSRLSTSTGRRWSGRPNVCRRISLRIDGTRFPRDLFVISRELVAGRGSHAVRSNLMHYLNPGSRPGNRKCKVRRTHSATRSPPGFRRRIARNCLGVLRKARSLSTAAYTSGERAGELPQSICNR